MAECSKRCDICSIEFQDIGAYEGHCVGRKHQKNVEQLEQQKKIEKSVFVLLPANVRGSDILDFFNTFGRIEKYFFGTNYVLLEFADREPAQYLLKNTIQFRDTKLIIRKRTQAKQQLTELPDSAICYENVMAVLENIDAFEDQLQAFLSTVQLTEEEVKNRYEAARTHLNSIFKTIFPKCTVYRFGSTVTGLGLKECDLDIYLNIGEQIYENELPTPNDWNPTKIFKEVKKIMFRMNAVFSNIIPIPKAKTPILKFLHIPTQVSCDISFKNSLAVYNSTLIKFCLSLDVRLTPLMMIIKYWAKHFEISGSGRITNYSLIMLTIFYLQQPSVKIIPPIIELQRSCGPHVIDGWQVNFDDSISLPEIENTWSIPQLLNGFFSFYSNFEFHKKVVCPLDGVAWPREDFARLHSLPEHFHRYKTFAMLKENANRLDDGRPMCVQDPIELAHNVTASTSLRIKETFQRLCTVGAKVCASRAEEDYKNLLPTLFTTLPKMGRSVEHKLQILPGQFLHIGLPPDFDSRTDIPDKDKFIRENWFFNIFSLIKDVFEKIYKLDVEVLCLDKESKQQKIEVLSDVHSKEHQTILLRCSGEKCVWRNRKQFPPVLDPSLSYLEKEAILSNKLIENIKPKDKVWVTMNFMCKFEKKVKPVHVLLTLTDESYSKTMFNEFGAFMRTRLPTILEKTLSHMKQYNKHY